MSLPVGNFMHRYSRKGSPLYPETQDRDRDIRTKLRGSGELQEQGAFGPSLDRTLQSGVLPVKGALPGVSAPVSAPVSVSDPAPVVQTDTNEFIAAPGETLFSQLGQSSEADRNLALALGGFKMAEAAGTPGATVLSALGKGGVAGVTAAAAARKNAQDRALKQKLYDVRLAKANAEKHSPMYREVKDAFPHYNEAQIAGEMQRRIKLSEQPKPGTQPEVFRLAKLVLGKDATEQQIGEKALELHMGKDIARRAQTEMETLERTHGASEAKKLPTWKRAKRRFDSATSVLNEIKAQQDAATAKQRYDLLKAKPHMAQVAKFMELQLTTADSTRGALSAVLDMNNGLYSGRIDTGGGRPTIDAFRNVMKTVGINMDKALEAAGIEISDLGKGQALNASQRQALALELKTGHWGNNPSNRDVIEILAALPGLGLDEAANALITQRLQRTVIANSESAIEHLEGNENYSKIAATAKKQLQQYKGYLKAQYTTYDTNMKDYIKDNIQPGQSYKEFMTYMASNRAPANVRRRYFMWKTMHDERKRPIYN